MVDSTGTVNDFVASVTIHIAYTQIVVSLSGVLLASGMVAVEYPSVLQFFSVPVEGGMKITLYNVNDINPDQIDINLLNDYYFQTMHHEFAHILHQTKNYDPAFDRITENAYIGSDWYMVGADRNAWQQGFVTPYAMSESREDFVENIAVYVTNTKDYWNNMLQNAGENGRALIKQKFEIVYSYMEQTWGINLDELREIVLRRQDDIANGYVDLSIIE